MKINKYEAVGIFASVALMAFALYLLQVDTVTDLSLVADDSQDTHVIVAGDGAPTQEDLLGAVGEAMNDTGEITKLIIDDVILGEGKGAEVGDTVVVHYVGALQNGVQFDNSNVRGEPFSFTLGEGRVIPGWEQGVIGMKQGGERVLVIPSEMAYGNRDVGPIPANSTLVFSIKLLEIN